MRFKSVLFFAIPLVACFGKTSEPTPKPIPETLSCVYVGGYGGYGSVNGMYRHDGEASQYRLAMGVDALRYEWFTGGVEGGVQSGNSMHVHASQTLVNRAGGLVPVVVLKPFLDLLLTTRWYFLNDWCLILKGGIAYRQLQFTDRDSSKDYLRKINGELQVGAGYQLTKHTRIVAYYQGIFSESKVGLTLSSENNVHMHHIPTQQSGLLGAEYTF